MYGRKWEEFERFSPMVKKYMYPIGEGKTMASQAVTAMNNLIYKWYNDGDVYDNTAAMGGWWNDISSYANWMWRFLDEKGLEEIFDIMIEPEYEELLYKTAERVFDPDRLEQLSEREKEGSIYDCSGPFRFEEPEDED